jgi:hypothetical protein
MRTSIKSALIATAVAVTLAGCTDPYSPTQRALGGGAIGAGAGALVGGAAGGGSGALTGAVIGGAVGALGGAATTPRAPSHNEYQGPPPSSGPYRY